MGRPDLKAIRARADAATRGPWRVGHVEKWHVFGDIGNPACLAPPLGRVVLRLNEHFPYEADAAFVAGARDDVPALCDRIEVLELALRDVLSVSWDVGSHPKTVGSMALRHARMALEGRDG